MADDLDAPLEVTEDKTPEAKVVEQTVGVVEEIAHPALKDYFNMDKSSDATTRKLSDVAEYFKDAEGTGEMLYQLRQLENRLGEPRVGENRLDKVHRYIKITANITDLEAERDSLLR